MDIYKAPESDLSDGVESNSTQQIKLYTPNQVAGGTFLGGPIGLIYFLSKNFNALSNSKGKTKAILFGSLFMFFAAVIVPAFNLKIPSSILIIVPIIVARYVAENFQMTKNKIINYDEYVPYSTWRVILNGIMCLIVSFVIITGVIIALDKLGIKPVA